MCTLLRIEMTLNRLHLRQRHKLSKQNTPDVIRGRLNYYLICPTNDSQYEEQKLIPNQNQVRIAYKATNDRYLLTLVSQLARAHITPHLCMKILFVLLYVSAVLN